MISKLMTKIRKTASAIVLFACLSLPVSAIACPNCKFANETESNRPRAYMYSILFMIGMPATIFTGFGISFYRMTKKAQLEAMLQDEASGDAGE